MKKILLLGAPGSGKGTISEKLILDYNFVHVSTGNIFREVIKNNLPYADELKSYMFNGMLVPDDLTNKIIKDHLEKLIKQKVSIVLDGYPRTIDQANFLTNIFELDKVIFLNVDENQLIERLTGRRMCSKCNKIYNIYFSPPKKDGFCDIDNQMLIQRKDDAESVVHERISTYKNSTFPLIEFYKNKNKLVEIDGSDSRENILKKVYETIK